MKSDFLVSVPERVRIGEIPYTSYPNGYGDGVGNEKHIEV